MKFVDRLKNILLEQKEDELAIIEERINELNRLLSGKSGNVEELRQIVDESSMQKKKVQSNIIDKRQMDDMTRIYEFVANYPRIEMIVEKIKQVNSPYENVRPYDDYRTDEIIDFEEFLRRRGLKEILAKLNREIVKIKDADLENLIKQDSEVEESEEKIQRPTKRGIFSKLIGKKNKGVKETETVEISKQEESVFEKYRKTIQEFNENYNKFLNLSIDDEFIIDKEKAIKIISNVNYFISVKKRGIELVKEDEDYLDRMEPHDLWKEIVRYYNNMSTILSIVQSFEAKIDEYEKLYETNPEMFDLKKLEKVFEENSMLIIDLKSKKKDVIGKIEEFESEKQDALDLKSQKKEAEKKKKEILEKKAKIKKAKSVKELGYKNKEDALKKLSIESKDYIVIPIPEKVTRISELFKKDKNLTIKYKDQTFNAKYTNNYATGRVNSFEESEIYDGALMIPISDLQKENIDSIVDGKINIDEEVLKNSNFFAILPQKRDVGLKDKNFEIKRFSTGNILDQVKAFLGDDYIDDPKEMEDYEVFKDIPDISKREKKLKREAVKTSLFENTEEEVISKGEVLVNGKQFYLNSEDLVEISTRPKSKEINASKLEKIVDDIETYLIEGENKGAKVDDFYKDLLLEYLRVNKKAKAEYQNEKNTTVFVKGKKLSIKPILPAKDEEICKRYSRPNEDIVYKTMKLASLINKFAHIAENNEDLQKKLFDTKLDLIEQVIDLAKENPNIKVKRQFDKRKLATSITVEIPGYNMIALHILNKSSSLTKKSNSLEENEEEVVNSSTIISSGVNRQLLLEMKKMDKKERTKMLLDLDLDTFYKLMIRMGYTSENISTKKDRKEFIEGIISDEKIDELIKDNDDWER